MSGMRFNDHGAPGSECAGRVAPGGGISEGEITGSKNNHRPKRYQHFADIGLGWRFVWYGRIDPCFEPVAFFTGIGITVQLKNSPGPFAP